jgi:hypothetical protein
MEQPFTEGSTKLQATATKVHQVFAELRRAVGKEIPAGELLRLAARLVNASRPRHYNGPSEDSRQTSDALPLDKAFADGGWHIMADERHWTPETDWDDDPRFAVANGNSWKMEFAA